jgi:hypothetical protein
MSDIRAITYDDAQAITPSDTVNCGPFVALQATTSAGIAQVTTQRGTTVEVYLPLGVIVPIAVTRVWSTHLAAAGIVGFTAPNLVGRV